MATLDDLDELALALPETDRSTTGAGRPEWRVKGKVFCRHREDRKDAVDPETGERMDDVLMFSTPDLETKDQLLETQPDRFFTTPHFDGYAAVLVRIPSLALFTREELDDLLVEAWLVAAPKRLAKAWLAEQQAD